MLFTQSLLPWLGSAKPAGGAELSQVVIATAGAATLTAAMLALIAGHRSGRIPVLGSLAARSERLSGVPGWAALPADLLSIALLVAVFGMYWDISLHIDNGRDAGPLANPAHYFILIGLFGVFLAGLVATSYSLRRPSRSSVGLPNGWHAPLGGVLIVLCGATSLMAFPLDDIWHRLFGQDVTLWGPTHLLLFGGASLATLGLWILHVEGAAAREQDGAPRPRGLARLAELTLAGAFLIGLSTFQGEFDFSVPQFRLVFHPVLLALAASVALVAARIRLGPGGALGAVAVFIAIRGLLAVTIGPVLGQTTPHFPLYLAEAGLVELIAWRFGTSRPLALGALCGAAIGTLGLAAEWGWSHVWATIPWPGSLLPEAAVAAPIAAVSGGILGGFIGRCLTAGPSTERAPRWAVPAAAVLAAGVIGYALPMPDAGGPRTAQVTLQEAEPPPRRSVTATVRVEPPDAARDARWFDVTAWQGKGSVVAPLREVAPGTYRTTGAVPVHGEWKSTVRLHRGREVLGLPIFMPEDPAIPAKGVPAPARFERSFVRDKQLLQREQKAGVPGVLTAAAYGVVLAIGLALIGALAWGLLRLERTLRRPPDAGAGAPGRSQPVRSEALVHAASAGD